MTAEGWALIIAAVFIGLVNGINAIGAHWGRKEAREAAVTASGKLDIIHELTNSKMTQLKDELAETKLQWQIALDRIGRLEVLLNAATKSGGP